MTWGEAWALRKAKLALDASQALVDAAERAGNRAEPGAASWDRWFLRACRRQGKAARLIKAAADLMAHADRIAARIPDGWPPRGTGLQ